MKIDFQCKARKIISLMILSVLSFALCFLTVSWNKGYAFADGGIVSDGSFVVKDGASVRLASESGIRFTTEVSKDFYNSLKAEYDSVTFGTLVNYDEVQITEITAQTPHTQNIESTLDFENAFASADTVDYSVAIVFPTEGVDETTLQAAYDRQLTARSYVKAMKGDVETVMYAQADDTVRSMRAVANIAIEKGGYSDDQINFLKDTYFSAGRETVAAEGYFESSAEKSEIVVAGAENGDYELYFGAKKVGDVTVTDGKFSMGKIFDLAVGEKLPFTLVGKTSHKVYNSSALAVTKALRTASDFFVFNIDEQTQTDGYYVLANDVDYRGEEGYVHSSHPKISGNSYGFQGVFDGQGYTATLRVSDGGIFGVLLKNSVVKNVAFNVYPSNSRSIAHVFASGVSAGWGQEVFLENVYVKMNYWNAPALDYEAAVPDRNLTQGQYTMFGGENVYLNMKNVIVEADAPIEYTPSTEGYGTDTDVIYQQSTSVGTKWYGYGLFTSYHALRKDNDLYKNQKKNVYFVTGKPVPITALNEYGDGSAEFKYRIYAGNEGVADDGSKNYVYPTIERYNTYADMKNADVDGNKYADFDNAFWDISEGYPMWKGLAESA